ncbi:hypothetical protein ACFU6I_23330 [Streptomyces sp. NPDC057486]|uniref:MmyB family transcriptional regulator n=1 Tax=Streptomyces sp. NPDC057486 TaxID=3346145 RepID=UPI00367DDEA9
MDSLGTHPHRPELLRESGVPNGRHVPPLRDRIGSRRPRLAALVGALSGLYPDFRRWRSAHDVAARTVGTKTLNHPFVGTSGRAAGTRGCIGPELGVPLLQHAGLSPSV